MSPPDLSWGEGGSQALGTSTNCTVAAPSPRVDLAWLALPWNAFPVILSPWELSCLRPLECHSNQNKVT